MKTNLLYYLSNVPKIWGLLATEIVILSLGYAILLTNGVSKNTTLLIILICAVVFILFGFLFFHKLFISITQNMDLQINSTIQNEALSRNTLQKYHGLSNNLPDQQRPQPKDFTSIPQHPHDDIGRATPLAQSQPPVITLIPRQGFSQYEWRPPQWIGGLFVILLLLASFTGYLSLRGEMQNYPQFGSSSPSWHICAIEPKSYHWHVLITLVDGKGKVFASQSASLMGEQVKIQAEVLNLLGTPSAYKIISLEGFYTNPRDEQNSSFPRNTITLDDGKTPLFSAATTQTWLSRLVNMSLAQPIVLTNDGNTYVLSETQNGLKPIAEKNSPLFCGFAYGSA
jgi:hypothetical protein